VFGLALTFSIPQLRALKPWVRPLVYALSSTAIYMVSGLVFSAFLGLAGADEFALLVWIWPGGFTAGLLGALLLAVAARLQTDAQGAGRAPLSSFWLPALIGAFAGVLFAFLCSYGEQQILLAWPLAFSIWQVSVGLAIRSRLALSESSLQFVSTR
jgi:hypothetical protein